MALEAVKVPADVQVEEKIIGPIGLRQLFLLLGGGGASYVLFNILVETNIGGPGAKIFAWVPLFITAAFAFFKINDISLLKLILLQVEKMDKPQVRTFGPRRGIVINVRTGIKEEKRKVEKKASSDNEIEQLSTTLDKGPEEMAAADQTETIVKSTVSNDMALGADDIDLEELPPVISDRINASDTNGPLIDGFHQSESSDTSDDDIDTPSVFRDLFPPQS